MKRRIVGLLKKNIPVSLQRKVASYINIPTGISSQTVSTIENRECIFVHIPKCAGVAIQKGLFKGLRFGHQTIRQYQIALDEETFNNAWKITMVRNPWERLVSAWTFLENGGYGTEDRRRFARYLAKYKNFDGFVQDWLVVQDLDVCEFIHFRPQLYFLKNLRGKVDMDYVARFESIEDDYRFIRERLGGDKLHVHNKTNRALKSMRDYYRSKDTVQAVNDKYSEDISFLQYRVPDDLQEYDSAINAGLHG